MHHEPVLDVGPGALLLLHQMFADLQAMRQDYKSLSASMASISERLTNLPPSGHEAHQSSAQEKHLAAPIRPDAWNPTSSQYNLVEPVTKPMDSKLVEWVDKVSPFSAPCSSVMDAGCGTGNVIHQLKTRFPDVPVLAVDASAGMVDSVRHRAQHEGWKVFRALNLDAGALTEVSSNSLTHALSGFMIPFAATPQSVVDEIFRVLQPGGTFGLATWGDAYFQEYVGPWNKACKLLNPTYQMPQILRHWVTMDQVRAGVEKAGFRNVEVRMEKAPWRWEDREEIIKFFFESVHPNIVKCRDAWTQQGGVVEDVRPAFKEILSKSVIESEGKEAWVLTEPIIMVVGRK